MGRRPDSASSGGAPSLASRWERTALDLRSRPPPPPPIPYHYLLRSRAPGPPTLRATAPPCGSLMKAGGP
ncbi:unnamed protein product [Gadus morhua 'NCC']